MIATRTRTLVLLAAIVLVSASGCIGLDDHAGTVYNSPTAVPNPYEGELQLHDEAAAAPTVKPLQ